MARPQRASVIRDSPLENCVTPNYLVPKPKPREVAGEALQVGEVLQVGEALQVGEVFAGW